MAMYFVLQLWFHVLDAEAWVCDAYQIILTGWMVVKALRHYFIRGEERVIEAAAMLLCISSITVDVWAQFLGFATYYTAPRTLIIFVIAVLASLFHRNIKLYESQQVLNDLLEEKVNEQQVSLEASYQKMRELDQERTLSEERRRLLSDMHDGIGGQLVSLLAGLNSGRLDNREVKDAIEQSLQDLRLLIDSMDEVSDDLVVALGTFRNRIEPLMRRAGIEMDWQMNALQFGSKSSPRHVLNVFRILQEGVTNVIKHADATRITIRDELIEDQYAIHIVDDGSGITNNNPNDHDSGYGYGLNNMKARAENLNGRLEVASSVAGTTVTLSFPAPLPV